MRGETNFFYVMLLSGFVMTVYNDRALHRTGSCYMYLKQPWKNWKGFPSESKNGLLYDLALIWEEQG